MAGATFLEQEFYLCVARFYGSYIMKKQVIAGPPTTPLLHHSHALTHKNPPTIFQNDRQSILQTQVQTSRLLHACLHPSLHQRSSKLVPVGTSAVLSEAAFLGHKQCLN